MTLPFLIRICHRDPHGKDTLISPDLISSDWISSDLISSDQVSSALISTDLSSSDLIISDRVASDLMPSTIARIHGDAIDDYCTTSQHERQNPAP